MQPKHLLYFLLLAGLTLGACSKSRKASARQPMESARKSGVKSRYAKELGVDASRLENEGLYLFIDAWKGTPYRYGGTTQSGVDCSGFVGAAYREVYRQSVPRTTGELSKKSKSVAKNQLREGDLVFFDINGKKSSHVGIYLINNKFVHASSSKGVIVSDLGNPYYQKAFAKGGKL